MLRFEKRDIFKLLEYENNANDHPEEQVEEIAGSITDFGYNDPMTVDENDRLVTGHGTRQALMLLVQRGREDLRVVDVIVAPHMSERQKRAYILAHNRISRNSKWNFEKLAEEINYLVNADFDVESLGFNEQEIDSLLKVDIGILPEEPEPQAPEPETPKEKRSRAKSKVLHTCPNCNHEFTA